MRPDRPRTELGTTAQAFDEMLDAVEGAEEQAIGAEQRLRHFLSDAAHELRTPIAGVQAASEHLLRSDPPRAEREQTLLTLVREARRAGRLVDDMLLMARIDRGLELRRHRVELVSLVHSALEPRRLRHAEATLRVLGDPTVASVDADRVAQVVGNLVDNAVRAAGPAATVTVTVSRSAPHPDHAHGTPAAVVTVEDDGPGLAPADRERVFERFVRLADGREHTGGDSGAGLGLAIARGIARAHGGDLVATEPHVRGARLELTLPLGVEREQPCGTVQPTSSGADDVCRPAPDETDPPRPVEASPVGGRAAAPVSPTAAHVVTSRVAGA